MPQRHVRDRSPRGLPGGQRTWSSRIPPLAYRCTHSLREYLSTGGASTYCRIRITVWSRGSSLDHDGLSPARPASGCVETRPSMPSLVDVLWRGSSLLSWISPSVGLQLRAMQLARAPILRVFKSGLVNDWGGRRREGAGGQRSLRSSQETPSSGPRVVRVDHSVASRPSPWRTRGNHGGSIKVANRYPYTAPEASRSTVEADEKDPQTSRSRRAPVACVDERGMCHEKTMGLGPSWQLPCPGWLPPPLPPSPSPLPCPARASGTAPRCRERA